MADDKSFGRIITRQEANGRGLIRYFPGSTCKYGHVSERFTSNGKCISCTQTAEAKAAAIDKTNDWRSRQDPAWLRERDSKNAMRWARNNPEASQAINDRYLAKPGTKKKRAKVMKNQREANAEHIANYDYEYKKQKYEEDINFKLSLALRTRLNQALKRNSKAGLAVRDLGCSIDEFREHIASQFQPGMTWENWGVGAGKWHLDHIKPLAELDMRLREDFLIGAHWSNYRPLWSEENSGRRTNLGRGKFGKSRLVPDNAGPEPI